MQRTDDTPQICSFRLRRVEEPGDACDHLQDRGHRLGARDGLRDRPHQYLGEVGEGEAGGARRPQRAGSLHSRRRHLRLSLGGRPAYRGLAHGQLPIRVRHNAQRLHHHGRRRDRPPDRDRRNYESPGTTDGKYLIPLGDYQPFPPHLFFFLWGTC